MVEDDVLELSSDGTFDASQAVSKAVVEKVAPDAEKVEEEVKTPGRK